MNKQIRNAEKAKIPIIAVVGDKEVETNSLSMRIRAAGGNSADLGAIPVTEVIERMQKAIASYSSF